MTDDFTPPGRSEDYPAAPQGYDRLLAELSAIKTRLSDLPHGLLRQAGISVEPGVLRVTQDLAVDGRATVGGELAVTGLARLLADLDLGGNGTVTGLLQSDNFVPGASGWRLTSTGLEVNTLTAKDAIIGNQALSDPLAIVAASPATATGWTVSTGHAAKASSSIAVPAGYSRATVFAQANMHFQDSAPNGGWVRATIAGNAGAEMGGLANLSLGQSATHTASLAGLSGGSISVSCDVRASAASGSGTGRIAQITAVAFFQR